MSPFKSIVELDIRSILQPFLYYLGNFFVLFCLFCFPLICDRDREDKPSNRSRGPRENRHLSFPFPSLSLLVSFSSCSSSSNISHIFRLHDSTICPQLAVLCCHNIFQKIQCMLLTSSSLFLSPLPFPSPYPPLSLLFLIVSYSKSHW